VYRQIIAKTLAAIDNVQLVGTASSLESARRKIPSLEVDAVTVDVQLRNESGLDLLPWLSEHFPRIVTVLVTAGLAREARLAVDALLLGASALVLKPGGPNAASALTAALRSVFEAMPQAPASGIVSPSVTADLTRAPREIVAVGASTGGPPIVVQFLKKLDASFDIPILVTQHMAALHAPFFAELLARSSGRAVRLAVHGDVIEPGGVYVAGNDRHMGVARAGNRLIVVQEDGPFENQCRPAVDPMFRSVAAVCGARAVGVVMSGMGSDGMRGALALQRRGAPVIVQDRETSIVWGMPGATVAAGAATAIVPAADLAAAVMARSSRNLSPASRTS
jgi:two-component system, chemotaxis family, protein-glutamate methylesterase/glutaminase